MVLQEELAELQRLLGQLDLLTQRRPSSNLGVDELLLVRRRSLTLRMYKESGHNRPHLHIDYGNERHVASYGIDPPERLAGSLDRKYDRIVKDWILARKELLLETWNALQQDSETADLVTKLQGD